MAQAFRSKKGVVSLAMSESSFRVAGCYNLDHKVVVEWEMFLDDSELQGLIGELPGGPLAFNTIRLAASSWCQTRDTSLTSLRFTHYRINRESTAAIIAWAEERCLLMPEGPTSSSAGTLWIRQPIPPDSFENS